MKSSATLNPVLSTYAAKFLANKNELAGIRLFPVFNTNEQSGDYYVLDRENLLNIPTDIRRAPGTPYKRSMSQLSSDGYYCKDYGVAEPIDDAEARKYASRLDADKSALNRALYIVLMNHEMRVKAMATSAAVPHSTPTTKWNASTGSNPISDVDMAREVIHDSTGMDPNVMLISRDVFNVLKEHPSILEKIKYTQKGIVTADLLAMVFNVEEMIIAGGLTNTASEGQATNIAKVWGKDVILAVRNTAQDLRSPNFGRTFNWTSMGGSGEGGIRVESYRDEDASSFIHRARQYTDEKLVGAEAGYHLSDVLS